MIDNPHALIARLDTARADLAADHPFSGVRYDRRLTAVRDLEQRLANIGWAHPARRSTP